MPSVSARFVEDRTEAGCMIERDHPIVRNFPEEGEPVGDARRLRLGAPAPSMGPIPTISAWAFSTGAWPDEHIDAFVVAQPSHEENQRPTGVTRLPLCRRLLLDLRVGAKRFRSTPKWIAALLGVAAQEGRVLDIDRVGRRRSGRHGAAPARERADRARPARWRTMSL